MANPNPNPNPSVVRWSRGTASPPTLTPTLTLTPTPILTLTQTQTPAPTLTLTLTLNPNPNPNQDSEQSLPLERAGVDFSRPADSDGGGPPGTQRCTCVEPGNPRPSHNSYVCRTGESAEVSEKYFCPLRLACVPAAEWAWEGPERRPCALWTGTAWEYNSKRTPTTNSWAAPPIAVTATLPMTSRAQPLDAADGSLPTTAAHLESRHLAVDEGGLVGGFARLRSLTAKATATLDRLRDRAHASHSIHM